MLAKITAASVFKDKCTKAGKYEARVTRVTDINGTPLDEYFLGDLNSLSLKTSWEVLQKSLNFIWNTTGLGAPDTDGARTVVYDGTYHEMLVIGYEGLCGVGGDADTVNASYNEDYRQKDIGPTFYTARVVGLSNANYKIGNNDTFKWKIIPRTIDIVWNPIGGITGGATEKTYTGSASST